MANKEGKQDHDSVRVRSDLAWDSRRDVWRLQFLLMLHVTFLKPDRHYLVKCERWIPQRRFQHVPHVTWHVLAYWLNSKYLTIDSI